MLFENFQYEFRVSYQKKLLKFHQLDWLVHKVGIRYMIKYIEIYLSIVNILIQTSIT